MDGGVETLPAATHMNSGETMWIHSLTREVLLEAVRHSSIDHGLVHEHSRDSARSTQGD
jgi:hypothetical protein